MTRLSALSLGAALASATALAAPAFAANTTSLSHEIVLEGLENPWDVAFLEDGTMFFTEKCLGLSVRLPDGSVNKLLGMKGTDDDYASTAEDLFCEGQAGMQGVAVDPDFAENRQIYVYSTSDLTAPGSNRLLRMTVGEDLASVADRTDIVEDVPYKPAATDHPFGGPGAHNGGRVRFGPDGFIYLTTGDTHNGEGPQSPTLLAGKVLRIDRDGNAAEGNAPPEGFDPRIYTYGHRNTQGITFHPETGAAITAEHGPWHSDEITVLQNGGNAGWDPRPNVGGRGECPDGYCGYSPNQMEGMDRYERAAFMPMTDLATYPDAMQPIWDNNGWSQGTSSAEFLTGDQWGDWENHLVVGIMGIGFGGTPIGQRIDVIELNEAGTEVVDVTEMTLPMEPGRFRSLVQGPDGALYAVVDQGMIHKMMP
ncbi:putative soluble aldose sugar dehydrogenase [Dinoroseobacter shibae DFL 12 = DSM 16493]|jgi:glucose/arabinose dehydrogenase|uniref:Putative soluble aldose sugar dehydrogenase n=1 Tax=Dinoroseobacter shibae (strain DSM 16493 / NCIMB 14021 / DFL 12) TaxID=398580 RepID=A8LNA1_DINSH|nr:PQQ-dependent sugar dehydrogenase [Dinoroseobacter shibae]ABV93614.1 putative soluble aldose sugar dehydrogenase [Dinoroseobacter shibae DFL 12 = DSM 16493]URF45066.1 PQQ-dependent sugar dehydrogenase [Dinoroseobacter shibae]URF49370.1 PQQ-dependent sugar dehydrogenase [Dinoroseobacter shibae]